jgi:phage tail sheath protein FI
MALDPKTPGVYIQEVSIFPPSIAPVATAIPAFIGYTELPQTEPKRITSMVDYTTYFGGPHQRITIAGATAAVTVTEATRQFSLYYAMQMYFANGGGPCYVISTGIYSAAATPAALADFGTAWNTGALGLLALEDEPTLIVTPDARLMSSANFYNYCVSALDQCSRLQDRFVIMDVFDSVDNFRNGIGNQYLKYGAVYYPDLVTSLSYPDSAAVFDTSGTVAALDNKTLAGAVVDADTTPTVADQLASVITTVREEIADLTITMPPSAAIAGVYAATDRNRGVWKAPANVSLTGVVKPSVTITHEDQEDLNVHSTGKSINAIRAFTGKGILVWGSRTLAGNDNEWRYVPVRRLFIFVEESIKKATEFVVFEPNDGNTWLRVKTMIENFLTNLWKDGALAGATPKDAFFVKVGINETMTADDILNGKLIIEIGMAAVRPAEFIILKFSHKLQES